MQKNKTKIMPTGFSRIAILIVVLVVIVGGGLAWQGLRGVPKEETQPFIEGGQTPQDGQESGIEKSIFSDQYIFIEYHKNTHIEVKEGIYPGEFIDSPTYNFNEESGTLGSYLPLDVNDDLILIFGKGSSVSGRGGGRESILYMVYQLPYQSGDFSILEIDNEGTVRLEYKEDLIVLKSGEEWKVTTSEIDVTSSGIAEWTIIERIKNYGLLEKSKIENR